MKPIELRRHNEIIAFRAEDNSLVALHGFNMEVAEISEESFAQMTPITISTGEIPDVKLPDNSEKKEAFDALTEWNAEENPNAKSGKLEFGIRSINLNVNQICNLKCAYCAAGGDGTYGEPMNKISIEKTLPQLKFFLMQLKAGQKFRVIIIGGEPLLYPEAIKAVHDYLFAEATARGITPVLSIVTNGTLLTGKTLELIRSLKIEIKISLDGAKEINDIVRPSKNNQSSTDQTVAGITELAKDRGQVSTWGISAISTSKNPETLKAYQYLRSLNPDWLEFHFDVAEKSQELQDKHIEQMNLIASEAWKNGGENELRKIRQFDQVFALLDSQLRLENHCGAGKTYLMVDAKNKMYPCVWEAGDKTQVVGENEQLDHAKLSNYSKSLIELNNCQTCWARHFCGGGCMYINKLNNGSKHVKDKMFCERTRSLLLPIISYYKLARSAE